MPTSSVLLLATAAIAAAFSSSVMPPPQCETAKQPPIPGVMPGLTKPKILLAQDVDWPPYAFIAFPPEGDYTVAGFGKDVAMGLKEVCEIDVEVTQAEWAGCWSDDKIGADAKMGLYHACMTYTHTIGSRPRWMEFSHSILEDNKAAGILTTLDADGVPAVSAMSDLSGKKVVDVNGWAPTQDGLAVSTNVCTDTKFKDYEWVTPSEETQAMYENENDKALKTLLNGEADAMFVYADQVHTYDCNPTEVGDITWDCDLWSGLGTKFAYIQTGLFEVAFNGTTLTMAKKGSGVAEIVNPCIDKFIQTKSYYDVCVKHGFVDSCYKNEFFPGADEETYVWNLPTSEQTGGCSSGYCGCSDTP